MLKPAAVAAALLLASAGGASAGEEPEGTCWLVSLQWSASPSMPTLTASATINGVVGRPTFRDLLDAADEFAKDFKRRHRNGTIAAFPTGVSQIGCGMEPANRVATPPK